MPAERTPHADDSLLTAPLLALTEWSLRAPLTVLFGAAALALLAVAVTVNGLSFKTSRLDLLNPRSEYNRRWLAYLAEFGQRDDAVIVVRSDEAAALTAAIDDLAKQLGPQPQFFESVFYRRDLSRLKDKALHYLPPEELAQLQERLRQAAAALPPAGQPADPAAALARLNDQLTHVSAATAEQRAAIQQQYARAIGPLVAALAGQGAAPPQSPAPTLPAALNQFDPQYLQADNGRIGFVLTKLRQQPGESTPATAIAQLREIIRQAQSQHQRVWIGLTGMPVIEYDEMQASQTDMVWTSVLSLGMVIALYLAAYGGLRHALLLNVVLVLATTYSFGFATLAVGHLNILSSAFSAVLIGLGIDFAIHYVASYLKLRRQGLDEEESLLRTAVEVGPGVVTGGVTTAAAFFMAAMTDFVGVRELGLIAGGSILLCVASAIVILPPLVLLVDRRWPSRTTPEILPAGQWLQLPLCWPRMTLAASALATLVVGSGAVLLRYDHNLLNLQPRHLESADIERQLLNRMDDSVWFAVSVCSSRQELRERKAGFAALAGVAKTEEIGSLLPDASPQQAERIAAVCRDLAAIPDRPPPPVPLDLAGLAREVTRAHQLLSQETPFETPATAALAQLRAALAAMQPAEADARLKQALPAMFAQVAGQLAPLRAIASPVPPRLDDLPPELVDRYVGKNRTWLLKVYARGNIWNMQQLEEFVHAVESVDPRVTGHPVQTYYASRHMQSSYLWAGLYALVAVLVLLWIDFRSLAHSLLAMLPLAVGVVLMCGTIGWLGLPLNPANMIVLPLILGIGVDHGVHLVHHWRQQSGRFELNDSTATAVLLTAATTTASFGALILARHQGLQSLGQVLTIGVTTCLAASIVMFPAVLAWLSEARQRGTRSAERGVAEEERWSDGEKERQSEDIVAQAAPEPARAAPAPAEVPPLPLTPIPVTEEEIAALLDSALHPRLRQIAELPEDLPQAAPLRRRAASQSNEGGVA
ncbi:MAG TPA: MMPL family transporter [Pirellulaceae bacterium]|nr:MMPL family transporter [Pirellulaceae bacterium]